MFSGYSFLTVSNYMQITIRVFCGCHLRTPYVSTEVKLHATFGSLINICLIIMRCIIQQQVTHTDDDDTHSQVDLQLLHTIILAYFFGYNSTLHANPCWGYSAISYFYYFWLLYQYLTSLLEVEYKYRGIILSQNRMHMSSSMVCLKTLHLFPQKFLFFAKFLNRNTGLRQTHHLFNGCLNNPIRFLYSCCCKRQSSSCLDAYFLAFHTSF